MIVMEDNEETDHRSRIAAIARHNDTSNAPCGVHSSNYSYIFEMS